MTRRIYERFLRSFQNPTKLSIMLLLTQKKEMTVTQMSKYIGVTRANLYQTVAELVTDGMVSEPLVQVKKNYVEKYYRLNSAAFRAVDPFELQRRLGGGVGSHEYRGLLESFFASLSVYFKIYAHLLGKSSTGRLDDDDDEIIKGIKEERILVSTLTLDDEQYAEELRELRALLGKVALVKERNAKTRAVAQTPDFSGEGNRIFVVAMPRSLTRPAP